MIYNAAANVFAFIMFVVYCLLWVSLVVMMGFLLYFLIGGPLNMFGVFVPGISIR